MPIRRGYRQACGIAHALDLVGERWALLIVRELLLGPKRFTDLRTGLPGISPNALTARLNELTTAGVARRRMLAPPAAARVYELTDWGRQLEPMLLALGTWALGSSRLEQGAFVSLDSVMLTVRTYFRANATGTRPDDARRGAPEATLDVQLDGDPRRRFGVWLSTRGADVRHEPPPAPDATVASATPALLSVFVEHERLPAALAADEIHIEGDAGVARRLVEGVVVPRP